MFAIVLFGLDDITCNKCSADILYTPHTNVSMYSFFIHQPPVAKKDPNAVNAAQMLRKGAVKIELHSNGSEAPVKDISDHVRK